MPHADFVHLRVHTAYSLSEGAIHVKQLVKLCDKYAMPAVAVADTSNLFGSLEFADAAAPAGVQPIMACQLALTREDGDGGLQRSGRKPEPDPVVLYAQNEAGWAHLSALSSRAYLATPSGETPQIPWLALAELGEGLICLTGGPRGPVGRLLAEGQTAAAEAALRRLVDLFPGRLYVELHRHGLALEARIEPALIDLAYALNLPLVAVNEVFFADEAMAEAEDALLCIAERTVVAEDNRRRLTPDHRFKSPAEMRALFADLPEACDNTLAIARRCAVRAPARKPILPHFEMEGLSEPEALTRMAENGLAARLAVMVDLDPASPGRSRQDYQDRLAFELKVIVGMGFAGYFLIVADFIQWAKKRGIPVGPGRGSGAGSVVAWALTITDLDPLRFGLLFERFLNPERVSMPDFDIDFCQDRREEVIRYVQTRYGHDQVAQIITFGKLQARAALRDVGRVLGLPYGQVDKLCKLVPNNPANPVTLAQALESEPRLAEASREEDGVKRLMDIALKLEGLYRHASTHAAGVVIGDRPLAELTPLYRDPHSEMPVTQYSMKYAELAGLVKFDFLGLKTLTVLERTLGFLRRRGITVDLAALPLDDRKTFDMLGRGETVGVFQLESQGMRDVLRKLKPDKFEDIIAVVALYRPGPMDNIPTYIDCKQGRQAPDYLHPTLRGVLEETYGVIIYQEQVMQIAQILAGYSLGGADLLRRAMGKKIQAEMDKQRDIFVKGAVAKGVEQATASHIFDLVNKFAGYGFNKSHAAAYALVAYQTAWLKASHPVEFLAGSMSLDISNTDKLNVFKQELDRTGVALLPPDVNRSDHDFSVEARGESLGVRYALAAIKGVGRDAMRSLVEERDRGGRFKDLFDLADRVDPQKVNRKQWENLTRAGAFDALEPNRARILSGLDRLVRHAAVAAEERGSSQIGLFGGVAAPRPSLPEAEPWAPHDLLQQEFEAVGFYLSSHPLEPFRKRLERIGWRPIRQLTPGSGRRIAGTLLTKKERRTQAGKPMAHITLSDPTGTVEVTLFSESLTPVRDLLEPGRLLVVTADVDSEGEGWRVTAKEVKTVEQATAATDAGLKLWAEDDRPLKRLADLLGRQGPGRGRVELILTPPGLDQALVFDLGARFRVDPTLVATLAATPGVLQADEI